MKCMVHDVYTSTIVMNWTLHSSFSSDFVFLSICHGLRLDPRRSLLTLRFPLYGHNPNEISLIRSRALSWHYPPPSSVRRFCGLLHSGFSRLGADVTGLTCCVPVSRGTLCNRISRYCLHLSLRLRSGRFVPWCLKDLWVEAAACPKLREVILQALGDGGNVCFQRREIEWVVASGILPRVFGCCLLLLSSRLSALFVETWRNAELAYRLRRGLDFSIWAVRRPVVSAHWKERRSVLLTELPLLLSKFAIRVARVERILLL
ncbi:hypothetical protein KC349_g293 [Hortaea werneckii]|nr:hypothetical protein KC349_g293 [Hortaea werneckii]